MRRPKILFQGSHVISRHRQDPPESLNLAVPIAREIGAMIIKNGFDLILTSSRSLDKEVGYSAVQTCKTLGLNPREHIRSYPYGKETCMSDCYGMVLEPLDRRHQEVRTFVIQESDAIIALIGGKGTSDCIQKAVLSKKPVFPIAIAGGGAKLEWERLKRSKYFNKVKGDIDFLADRTMSPSDIIELIIEQCKLLLLPHKLAKSKRIFIVHGHDSNLKNELARLLERIDFIPVILHEQPDMGKTIFYKLETQLSDIGYAFILLTPDDTCHPPTLKHNKKNRARQNVVFEHGLLIGILGPENVCAIVKGEVELPSDLSGVLYKQIPATGSLNSVALDIIKELKNVGYEIDANKL